MRRISSPIKRVIILYWAETNPVTVKSTLISDQMFWEMFFQSNMFIVHCILYIIIRLNVKGKRKGDFLNQGSVVQGHYVWQEGLGRDFTSEDAIGREWRYRKLAKFQKLCGSRFLSPQKVAEKWRQKVNCSICSRGRMRGV